MKNTYLLLLLSAVPLHILTKFKQILVSINTYNLLILWSTDFKNSPTEMTVCRATGAWNTCKKYNDQSQNAIISLYWVPYGRAMFYI